MIARSVPFLIAGCVLAAAAPAVAEDEEQVRALAQQLFDEAEALLSAKHVAEACPKYAASYRLDPHLGVLIYLAECYEHNGQLASAWGAFREAEGMAQARKDQRLSYARDRIDALTPRLSRLTVSVPTETRVEGLTLYRSGLELLPAAWGTPTPTDPGSYVLEAKAPGRRHWTTSVVVPPEGGTVNVTVPVLAPGAEDLLPVTAAPAPAPAPVQTVPTARAPQTTPPDAPRPTPPLVSAESSAGASDVSRRVTALALGGLGFVGLGVGGALGVGARSKYDESASLCNDANVCTPAGTALRESAQSKALVASVLTGVGVAAVASGLVLWLTAPTTPAPSSARAAWSVVPATSGWGVGAHRAF
ncbi:MAG: hypothetical protein EOO73_14510 [Myxococcales bacterium]|nr:MAG: hypothetical protein EOO73_14510 [Myxococcales bacterium]